MHCRLLVVLCFLLCPALTPLLANQLTPIEEKQQFVLETQAFLKRLGFEDYSYLSKESLKTGHYTSELGKLALEENAKRYEMINSARDLATDVYSEMTKNLKDPEARKRVIQLTAQLLDIKPIKPPGEIPNSIQALPQEQRAQALKNYISKQTRHLIDEHAARLASNLAEATYGKANLEAIQKNYSPRISSAQFRTQVTDWYDKLVTYLERAYLDRQIGKTQFLGRAMTALIARRSALSRDPDLMEELRQACQSRGIFLENFIGNEWTVHAETGIQKTKIDNMALILNHSDDPEEAKIASSVLPGNKEAAKKHKLNGNPLGKPNSGFSHIAYANVFEDAETGIHHVLLLDTHPLSSSKTHGGVRLFGVEQLGDQPSQNKLGIASFDKNKFLKFAQKQVRERGYLEEVFPSYEVSTEEGHLLPTENPKPQNWKSVISAKDFKAMHAEINSTRWYHNWAKHTANHIRRNMLAKDGVWFSTVDGNGSAKGHYHAGATYSSQLGELASLQATGISLQEQFDQHPWYSKAANKTREIAEKNHLSKIANSKLVKSAVQVPMNERIISPSGLVAQSHIAAFKIANYPTPSQPISERNSEISSIVADALAASRAKIMNLELNPLELEETRSISLSSTKLPRRNCVIRFFARLFMH